MAKKTTSKGFFALDVHQFQKIQQYDLGIEEAATYLCLLKSTDQSNVTSIGGVHSVMEYSGLSRSEAKRAIKNLEKVRLVDCLEVERARARTIPRYNLPILDKRPKLSAKEAKAVEAVRAGQQPIGPSEIQAVHRAATKGWVERLTTGWSPIEHANSVAFIPNTFVKVSNGHSPLHRLVNGGELGPIMLTAELYQLQNLMDERGIPLEVIRRYFKPTSVMHIDRHRLHYLEPGREYEDEQTGESKEMTHAHNRNWRSGGGEAFWSNLGALDAAHITEWTIYSSNGRRHGSDYYECNRPQRPLGVLRNGRQVLNTPESRPAFMSYLAWRLSKGENLASADLSQIIGEWREASPIVALENTSVSHVEGVGILRLAHRASTENVSVWYRDLRSECEDAFFFTEQVLNTIFPQAPEIIERVCNNTEMQSAISMELNG